LLKLLRDENMPVEETQIEPEEVLEASEVFLTNAIYGIRWVKQVGNSGYTSEIAKLLHKKLISGLLV
jgi:branched-chain amino acid aminotransferase